MDFSLNGAKLSLDSVNSGNLRNHWSMNQLQYKNLLCNLSLWSSGIISVSYTGDFGFQPHNPHFWFLIFFVTEFSEFSENIWRKIYWSLYATFLFFQETKEIPRGVLCPMTTVRKGRRYLATVSEGEATSLKGDKSDVRLDIRKGCPKGAYLMEVRTDLSNFESFIQNDECFISPIVEVLAPPETSSVSYILTIPHCLHVEDDRSKVIVRMIHEESVILVPEREKCTDGVLFYDIYTNFIELHTPHFTKTICSICKTPYHCRERIHSIWYAKLHSQELSGSGLFNWFVRNEIRHDVEIRSYLCSDIHTMAEWRNVNIAFYCFQNNLSTLGHLTSMRHEDSNYVSFSELNSTQSIEFYF